MTYQAADRLDRDARESEALIISYREGREARLLGRELALSDSAYLRASLVRWYQHRARRAVRRGRRLRQIAGQVAMAVVLLLLGGQGCAARRAGLHSEIILLPPVVIAHAEIEIKETTIVLHTGNPGPDITARASIEMRWGGPPGR
jgi:hypothetical protein